MMGRYHFKQQFKQTQLEFFKTADRIDGSTYFHQCTQVARHQVERIVEADLHCRSTQHVALIKPYLTRHRTPVAFMREEEELRLADSDSVAMLKLTSLHRNIINESAVKTFKIGYYKLFAILLDD